MCILAFEEVKAHTKAIGCGSIFTTHCRNSHCIYLFIVWNVYMTSYATNKDSTLDHNVGRGKIMARFFSLGLFCLHPKNIAFSTLKWLKIVSTILGLFMYSAIKKYADFRIKCVSSITKWSGFIKVVLSLSADNLSNHFWAAQQCSNHNWPLPPELEQSKQAQCWEAHQDGFHEDKPWLGKKRVLKKYKYGSQGCWHLGQTKWQCKVVSDRHQQWAKQCWHKS